MANKPRSAVFTTVLWDGDSKIADFPRHMVRLRNHAERLRIDLPDNIEQLITRRLIEYAGKSKETQLLNIKFECETNRFILTSRQLPKLRNSEIHAMTLPLRKWLGEITGTKHGDWAAYIEAKNSAEEAGADIALLVDEYCIIDSDRAGIIVIDEDGVAYISDSNLSVNGITLEIVTEILEEMGIPVNFARLNERLVARSSEVIALGVGLGCCRIITIDGVQIGGANAVIANKCQDILAQHYSNISNWTDLCENPGQKV
tara:strand:+ start:1064 stop:1840 length:777 start_codon:yes stop_codon:yes gene_type:complete